MFYKGEIPFVRLVVPLIAGILLAYFFPNQTLSECLSFLTCSGLLILTLFIFSYKKFALYRFRAIIGAVCNCLILTFGYCLTIYTSEKYNSSHFTVVKADALVVRIISEPKLSESISKFEGQVRLCFFEGMQIPATGKIIISIPRDSTNVNSFKYGDLVLMPSMCNEIDPPYNPGEFDYKQYLENRQIYRQTYLSQQQPYLIDSNRGNPIISFALGLRKELVDKFHEYIKDEDAAAFASTLILGYRAELSRELIKAYSNTGTMHVLSVSGMHVGIVFMVLSVLLKFMDRTQHTRLIRALLIIVVIWLYALITGFSAPACRAAVMLSFIVLGKALNKHQNTYNLIAISAFILLVYNPFYIVDAGFQLSYLAVSGIVFFHPKIYQAFYFKNKLMDFCWSYSALSIAAQLATFPFSIYYFHQFPVYFLFSNLFIVLPVSVIMYAGILFMFISVPVILHYAGLFLKFLINYTNGILYYIENLPFSSLQGLWISPFECVLICAIIACTSYNLNDRHRWAVWLNAIIIIILVNSFSLTSLKTSRQHRIIFFNLGKKSGMAYVFAGRSVITSDIDDSDKLVDFSLLPSVRSMGSRNELFYSLDQPFDGESYFGDNNFYQFGSYRVLKWNKAFDNKGFTTELRVDAVFISGSPRITIRQIASTIKFTRIIIDANNPDYKIKRWIEESEMMNYKYYLLKKNPALILNL